MNQNTVRRLLSLTAKCPCGSTWPQYLCKNQIMKRCNVCRSCQTVRPLSAVSTRRLNSAYQTIMKTTELVIRNYPQIDAASAQDKATEIAIRHIGKYCTLNRSKNGKRVPPETYLLNIVRVAIRRWATNDGAGQTQYQSLTERRELNRDVQQPWERIAAIDEFNAVKDLLTPEEFEIISDYANGGRARDAEVESIIELVNQCR